MSRDRIAIVSHAHPAVSSGGAEISAYTLFEGLLSLGEDAVFIAACKKSDLNRVDFRVPGREFIIPFSELEHDWFYHISPQPVEQQLRAILDEVQPTIINFHHFIYLGVQSLINVARTGTARTFLTLHEFLALCQSDGQMVTRPHRRLCSRSAPGNCVGCWPEYDVFQFGSRMEQMRGMLNAMTGLISPSKFLADRVGGWGVDRTRISVIENGLTRLSEAPSRPARREGQPWVFGYFGQINPYKGVDVLLRAAEQQASLNGGVPDRLIRIHGPLVGQSAEFVERLERAVASGLVEYAGAYQNEQVGDLMAACDYVVVPSLWWENSPVVIQEAFAAQRPLLVSGIGGMAEKVQDGVHGLHFAVGNATDLLRAMTTAADAATYEGFVRQLARPLTAEDMARRYLEVFRAPLDAPMALEAPMGLEAQLSA